MESLLIAITTWLSVTYDFPANTAPPAIRYAQPLEIALLYHEAFGPKSQAQVRAYYAAMPPAERRRVVSVYDGRRSTIVLPDGWQPRSPAEVSMLVHELVHHLQAVSGQRYACAQEREKLAYEAQEEWLHFFGTSLEREFQIDGLTLLTSTTCPL